MANRDNKFFNCSEEHELNYVAGKYEDREKVKEFIRQKCADKTIHYWTQEKLAQYLAENGFKLKTTITQTEFVNRLAEKLDNKSQAQSACNAVFSCLSDIFKKGDSVAIKGFGTFKIIERSARKGRNPATGESIDIPASKTIRFTPAAALKDGLAEKN